MMYDPVFLRGSRADTCLDSLHARYTLHRGPDVSVETNCYSIRVKSRLFHRPGRLYLRSDETKSFPPCRREESNLVATTWVRAIINESLSFRLGSGPGPRALETKPLMISICIRPFRSFREEEEEEEKEKVERAPGPGTKSPVNYVRS